MSLRIFSLIKNNFEKRRPYLQKNKIEAFRLFHEEYGELPVAVDIYRDNAVIHVFFPTRPEALKALEDAVRRVTGVQNFFYKNRTKSEMRFETAHKEMVITEYGCKFHINLSDYLDTGLFLDHRETRKWIGAQSKNKIVLNTFAYTGSFSVHAARGGASKTYSVDLSRAYCEWIKKNLALNNLPPEKNWVYKMDTLEFFRYAKRKKLLFDIIVIDPPTFSRNKNSSFSVQKDHPALINEALPLLSAGGFILFSNNYRDFSLNKKALAPCHVEEKDMIPPDFEPSHPHSCSIIRQTL